VLAFKGGTALRRCWFEDYRFSEDLDFTLTRPITLEDILVGLTEIFAAVETACGLRIAFDREDRHSHQNSHGCSTCARSHREKPARSGAESVAHVRHQIRAHAMRTARR
jgi:predicted nucleotidyltransferase component of viral defense system